MGDDEQCLACYMWLGAIGADELGHEQQSLCIRQWQLHQGKAPMRTHEVCERG